MNKERRFEHKKPTNKTITAQLRAAELCSAQHLEIIIKISRNRKLFSWGTGERKQKTLKFSHFLDNNCFYKSRNLKNNFSKEQEFVKNI